MAFSAGIEKMAETIRIATRKSPLALWQAEHVAAALRHAHPGLQVEILGMSTRGDKILDAPLAKIGGKGLFLPVILEREDPRDAFVSQRYERLADLPQGARVGTSSLRRQCQLTARRPDLDIQPLRGNVNSRLAKLDSGEFDAILLAAAGLMRLGFEARIRSRLSIDESLPAIGQGAVGIECRQDDARVLALLAPLHHPDTAARVAAERAMNRRLQGGCQVPIAGHALLKGDELWLRGLVGTPDGTCLLVAEQAAPRAQAEELGRQVADELIAQGAHAILQALAEG